MTKLFLLLLAAPLAFGQANRNACGPETTAGTYVVTCSGFITPAQNAPSLPFTVLGTVTADKNGYFSGTATNSVAGTVYPQTVGGQASTASDCTGTITYNKGQQDELNVKYTILSDGGEIRGMVTNNGANVLCTLTRIGLLKGVEARSDRAN